VLALVVGPGSSAAQERRVAVVIGNNVGAPAEPPLQFAQRDALRVAQVLTELGFVAQSDLMLVLDGDADTVRAALDRAELRDATMLIIYYSGHADDAALHLGGTQLPWDELRDRTKRSSAVLRLAVVDACQAGNLITAKGLLRVPTTTMASESRHRGTALLAATESSELALETSALGGSFFTHYLVSGMRGAADANGDQMVTLAEAQAYATTETTRATAMWARAVQHPNYELELSGQGDLILTSLRESSALLTLDKDLEGHIIVTEIDSTLAAVELDKRAGTAIPVALPNGRYVVHLRGEYAVGIAELVLPWGGRRSLGIDDFSPRSYRRGDGWRSTSTGWRSAGPLSRRSCGVWARGRCSGWSTGAAWASSTSARG
jgi:uncharacterized caspase-like protein